MVAAESEDAARLGPCRALRPQPRGAAWRLTWRQPLRPPLRHNWRSLLTRLACAAWALAGSSARPAATAAWPLLRPACSLHPGADRPRPGAAGPAAEAGLCRRPPAGQRGSRPPAGRGRPDGTALDTVGQRYSHAGLGRPPAGPFTVRQLYHDCQRGAPPCMTKAWRASCWARNSLANAGGLLGPIHLAILWLPADAKPPLARRPSTSASPARCCTRIQRPPIPFSTPARTATSG